MHVPEKQTIFLFLFSLTAGRMVVVARPLVGKASGGVMAMGMVMVEADIWSGYGRGGGLVGLRMSVSLVSCLLFDLETVHMNEIGGGHPYMLITQPPLLNLFAACDDDGIAST